MTSRYARNPRLPTSKSAGPLRSPRTRSSSGIGLTGVDNALGQALHTRLIAHGRPLTVLPPVRPDDAVAAVPQWTAALAGVDTVVHLDASRDPGEAPDQRRRQLVTGTSLVLDAAVAAGVRRIVLVTSAEVYRGSPDVVPLPERSPLRIERAGGIVDDWLAVERLASAARRARRDVVVLRPAPLVGLGCPPTGLLRSLAAARLLAVRGVEPLWQLCHVDDLLRALELAATRSLRGAFAVASEGWLPQTRVEELTGRRRLELPATVALSAAERLHRLGVMTAPPQELDALVAPVVVDPARLRAAGWRPAWQVEDALTAHVASLPPPDDRLSSALAAGAAGTTAAVLGTAALVRRARRRRRGR